MIDFNHSSLAAVHLKKDLTSQKEDLRRALLQHLESVLFLLFPAGKKQGRGFTVGDVYGNPGDSLEVVLTGDKAGLWTDHASGEGGDIFDLIAAHQGIDIKQEFTRILFYAAGLVGYSQSLPPEKKTRKKIAINELGSVTAKWDYLDQTGKLIAVVYRYDTADGKKQFRPWDVKRRKIAPPDPRPLYNQPGISNNKQIILVEGEKCAQALIKVDICATTAMFGANAPVDKTDWSPFFGKTAIIWPDKDQAGWTYAEHASQAILKAGALSCAILYPPADKPKGWDAADAIAESFDVYGFLQAGDRVPVVQQIELNTPELESEIDWNTEDGLATAFTRLHGEDWRYCSVWGKWLVWNGMRWNQDQLLYIHYLSRNICRAASLKIESPRLRARLASASTIAAVERIARSDPQHASITVDWDKDPWLINTPGGTVNLHTGQLCQHSRQDRITKMVTAIPRGECPTWKVFLREVMGNDEELSAYLQRVVGYCLTGVTSAHALFFLYGTGANGKSVFVNTLASILGDYAANAPMDTFMESRSDRHPTDLAGLQGARFVCAVETEQGRRWNESKLKAITGGDKISARFMRQDFFEYTPQFKLVIAGNHKPSIRNIDEAIKRRFHLIPFTVTIPAEKRDHKLIEKLLAERNGILAWAVEGCLAWQRIGLSQPQSVLKATEEYFKAEDAMGRWLEERCVQSMHTKSLTIELFNDWKHWAEESGEFVGSQRRFSELLITRGIEKWRNRMGARGFTGIALRKSDSGTKTSYPYIND